MTSQQLELIARRGLTLPEPTLTRLRTVGIWCDANLTIQRRDQDWLIRGQESGGAVNDIGRYVSFCKEDGSPLSWLQPVKNFMPNGLHAILLAKGPIVRMDMYRFETSYDLLITSHTLAPEEGTPKPKLETRLIFFHRFGVLERELWGKDKMFRGAVAPEFFMSNGTRIRFSRDRRSPRQSQTSSRPCGTGPAYWATRKCRGDRARRSCTNSRLSRRASR